MSDRSGRLGVGVIGAGRVGPVLGAALLHAGHAVVGISAVSRESRERADALLPGVPVLDVPAVIERSELVLLAVPPEELAGLVTGLAATGAWQPGQLVVHTAAQYGCGVLAPAARAGAIPLAIHPAMAFTGTSVDLVRLRDSYCAVTSPGPVLPIAQALVVEMGAEPVVVAESDREAYAEAIATATSFSSAIVTQAVGILDRIGLDMPGRLLGPLVRSSVENALQASGGTSIDGSLALQDGIDLEDL
jgi:predicted short-subunit dehydrogenase-like oxidoreductase (DUF2520 family)